MDQFPPNMKSDASARREPKKVERVTSTDAKRRKKSLGKQFKETFVGGDAKTALRYVIFSVIIPAAKDMLAEAGSQGIEKLIYGDTRRKSSAPPGYGPLGHVAYNRMGRQQPPPRSMSRSARSRHDFDEILLVSRVEATDVLDRMYDIIGKYEVVTVSDLYELIGIDSTHVDHKWGWTDLRGAGIRKVRNDGYLLDLPQPEPLD